LNLASLNTSEKQELLSLLAEKQRRSNSRKILTYYPDDGPLRRDAYPKHMAFFEAGAKFRERCMLAANRIGKTEGVGGYEVALHLTGNYPAWWKGRRFTRPVKAWAAGDTHKTVRDILQEKLLGPSGAFGTGLIPGDAIERTTPKSGVPDAVDTVYVKHASGGVSVLALKSYQEGRESFQGTEQDIVWLDEEPPLSVYTECLTRTMTTRGVVLCTFTPLEGLSETVMHFLPDGQIGERADTRFVCMATWDDAPHLSEQDRKELWDSIPPYQRDARAKGVPQLGSGAIYPVPESEITCDPFEIPAHWPRAYGMDVGWNRTAAVWGALDRESSTLYLYSEHYQGQAEPSVHAHAIRSRGEWIPGVIDPAARGRNQGDGQQLIAAYRDLGLDIVPADNAVESGLYAVWQRLSAGRLKVFRTMQNWLGEYRLYRRDEKGRVVKERDHLMDATRYLVMSGLQRATTKPEPVEETVYVTQPGGWMR
jgi:phage terminase large subunit-like protein